MRVFHVSISWSLSDSKSPQVSRILNILADLNRVVVWMVSNLLLISKSSSPFNNPLVNVATVPIIIGIFVTLMFHSFFNSLARSRYVSFFSLSFSFTLWSAGTAKSTILQVLFFFSFFLIPWVSSLLTIFLHQSFKKESLRRKYTHLIKYQYTDQILLNN